MDGKEGGREMLPSGDSMAHDAHTSVKQSKLKICKETLYIAGESVRLDGPVNGAPLAEGKYQVVIEKKAEARAGMLAPPRRATGGRGYGGP